MVAVEKNPLSPNASHGFFFFYKLMNYARASKWSFQSVIITCSKIDTSKKTPDSVKVNMLAYMCRGFDFSELCSPFTETLLQSYPTTRQDVINGYLSSFLKRASAKPGCPRHKVSAQNWFTIAYCG
jgi:hypothetical protein